MDDLSIRDATADDAGAVAALHVASWRAAYRGLLDDAFLDGPVEADRLALWRGRLTKPAPDPVTLLCERDGVLLGFGCVFVDADPRWGSRVDNLHAAPAERRRGVGCRLMRELASRAAADRPVHLFCLRGNRPAQAFYERIGGRAAERCRVEEPDGRSYPAIRYVWPAPSALGAPRC